MLSGKGLYYNLNLSDTKASDCYVHSSSIMNWNFVLKISGCVWSHKIVGKCQVPCAIYTVDENALHYIKVVTLEQYDILNCLTSWLL
jgi:hypothetical protein